MGRLIYKTVSRATIYLLMNLNSQTFLRLLMNTVFRPAEAPCGLAGTHPRNPTICA